MPSVGFLISGAIVVAGVAYYMYKNGNNNEKSNELSDDTNKNNNKANNAGMKKLLSDDDKYNTYKTLIEKAVKEKDFNTLKEFLDSRAKNYPDLLNMIENTLKDKK